jgi:hypothetical protein
MQQAYIAQITKNDVSRFIFTSMLYQAHLFNSAAEAHSGLPPMPLRLCFRDGTTFTIDDCLVEELPAGWAISCVGPFDFTGSAMIEAIETP